MSDGLLDLVDEFDRLRRLFHLVSMCGVGPRDENTAALAELGWTLDERCDRLAAMLAKLAAENPGGARQS